MEYPQDRCPLQEGSTGGTKVAQEGAEKASVYLLGCLAFLMENLEMRYVCWCVVCCLGLAFVGCDEDDKGEQTKQSVVKRAASKSKTDKPGKRPVKIASSSMPKRVLDAKHLKKQLKTYRALFQRVKRLKRLFHETRDVAGGWVWYGVKTGRGCVEKSEEDHVRVLPAVGVNGDRVVGIRVHVLLCTKQWRRVQRWKLSTETTSWFRYVDDSALWVTKKAGWYRAELVLLGPGQRVSARGFAERLWESIGRLEKGPVKIRLEHERTAHELTLPGRLLRDWRKLVGLRAALQAMRVIPVHLIRYVRDHQGGQDE